MIETALGEPILRRDKSLLPLRVSRPQCFLMTGDLFHPEVPDGWIDFAFNVARLSPRHSFRFQTKNECRWSEYDRILTEESGDQTAYRYAVAMMHAGLENTPKDDLPIIKWPPENVTVTVHG